MKKLTKEQKASRLRRSRAMKKIWAIKREQKQMSLVTNRPLVDIVESPQDKINRISEENFKLKGKITNLEQKISRYNNLARAIVKIAETVAVYD